MAGLLTDVELPIQEASLCASLNLLEDLVVLRAHPFTGGSLVD